VRYLHDPNATQPVISQQLQSVDLRVLIDKIDKGLIFHHAYIGTKQIREASVNIHNIFRLSERDSYLSERDSFPVALFSELPLDSSQGLDSFLTVITQVSPMHPTSRDLSSSLVVNPSGFWPYRHSLPGHHH